MKQSISQKRVGAHGSPDAHYASHYFLVILILSVRGIQVFLNFVEVGMNLLETFAFVQVCFASSFNLWCVFSRKYGTHLEIRTCGTICQQQHSNRVCH